MRYMSITAAMAATLCLAASPVWAQQSVTENINNTGIPRNAPALGLANIYGLNPCATGATAGVTTPLFGIGGAISNIDRECETRNNAAVVITGLKDETLAREILCEIQDVRQAAIRVGKPCLRDQSSRPVAALQPPQGDQPVALASVEPKSVPMPTIMPASLVIVPGSIRADAPAFCRVKGLDLSLYPDCSSAAATASVSSQAARKVTAERAAVKRTEHVVKKTPQPEATSTKSRNSETASGDPNCPIACQRARAMLAIVALRIRGLDEANARFANMNANRTLFASMDH